MNALTASILEAMKNEPGSLDSHVIASGAEMAETRIRLLEKHLSRVLYLHQNCWHKNSVFQQEYGHEMEAARDALNQ